MGERELVFDLDMQYEWLRGEKGRGYAEVEKASKVLNNMADFIHFVQENGNDEVIIRGTQKQWELIASVICQFFGESIPSNLLNEYRTVASYTLPSPKRD